ncbi:MAG: hypothetical protein ABI200_03615 [Gaiellales bacterium]
MTALVTLGAGLLLALAAWSWSARSIDGSTRIALVAVLGVTASAFNVVVPMPSVEATTTIVLCTALALGARTGAAVGLVAVIGSSVTGGVGIWTMWQVTAVALVALIGAAAARIGTADGDWFTGRRLVMLGCAAAISALCWDVVTTAGSVLSIAPPPGVSPVEQLISFLLIGIMFTVVHIVCSVALTVLGGPPLLHALIRARPRLAGGTVIT